MPESHYFATHAPRKQSGLAPQTSAQSATNLFRPHINAPANHPAINPTFTQTTYSQTYPPANHNPQTRNIPSTQTNPRQSQTPKNVVTDILPYCTMEPPLSQDQVIALSDVAGSLRELVLLALGAAAGNTACVEKLEGAVGVESARGVVEFWGEEWEVD